MPSLVGQPPDTINAKVAVAAKPSSIKEKDKTKAKPVEDKPAEKVDEDMKTEPAITGGAKKRKVKKWKFIEMTLNIKFEFWNIWVIWLFGYFQKVCDRVSNPKNNETMKLPPD